MLGATLYNGTGHLLAQAADAVLLDPSVKEQTGRGVPDCASKAAREHKKPAFGPTSESTLSYTRLGIICPKLCMLSTFGS